MSEPESSFSLDMSLEELRPVTLREAPTLIRYDVDGDDEFYTLVVLDIGFGFLHAVVTNIPGNRVDLGDVSAILFLYSIAIITLNYIVTHCNYAHCYVNL